MGGLRLRLRLGAWNWSGSSIRLNRVVLLSSDARGPRDEQTWRAAPSSPAQNENCWTWRPFRLQDLGLGSRWGLDNVNTRVRIRQWTTVGVALLLGTGCSVRKLAVNKLGDALAAGGTTFSSDDDPELVKAAVPFSLKLMESLLEETPKHKGLLTAAASGFTQYAFAFVHQDADELQETDMAAAKPYRDRARRLYLRARDYGLRGLELKRPGFRAQLREHPNAAVKGCRRDEAGLLYWTAVSWAAAISISKDDPNLVADIALIEAMIDRALELDEEFGQGAIHSFLITYEMARQGNGEKAVERATKHFERAMELSGGKQAGPLVSYAEAVCIPQEDRAGFEKLLTRALAVDVQASRENRLVNLVMQRRAIWLLARLDKYFLPPAQ